MKLIDSQLNTNPSFAWTRKIETCDGIALRTAYWPSWRGSESLGTICLLQGRAETIEDYYETVRDLLEKGFAVLAFDWRGQGGSERLLKNPRKGHVEDFVEYQYDLIAVSRKLLPLTPKPHFCLAHGMGGAIALEAALRNISPFDRQVLVSPMVELSSQVMPALASAATWVGNTLGYGEEFISGDESYLVKGEKFTGNQFTSDEQRYKRCRDIQNLYGDQAVGMPTVSWLQAASRQMAHFLQADFARKMTIPTVAIVGSCDKICLGMTTERVLMRIKVAQTLLIRGARHSILMERDTYRRELWAAFDVFIPGESMTTINSKVA